MPEEPAQAEEPARMVGFTPAQLIGGVLTLVLGLAGVGWSLYRDVDKRVDKLATDLAVMQALAAVKSETKSVGDPVSEFLSSLKTEP